MPHILADRINVLEGIISDLLHLRIPNLWKEMGLSSEWKYNRTNFVRKTVVTTALIAGAVGFITLLSQRKENVSAR